MAKCLAPGLEDFQRIISNTFATHTTPSEILRRSKRPSVGELIRRRQMQGIYGASNAVCSLCYITNYVMLSRRAFPPSRLCTLRRTTYPEVDVAVCAVCTTAIAKITALRSFCCPISRARCCFPSRADDNAISRVVTRNILSNEVNSLSLRTETER